MVTIQLLDANGYVAMEQSSRPANGAYPTTEWQMGKVQLDWHDLLLPSSMKEGSYTLRIHVSSSAAGVILGELILPGKLTVVP